MATKADLEKELLELEEDYNALVLEKEALGLRYKEAEARFEAQELHIAKMTGEANERVAGVQRKLDEAMGMMTYLRDAHKAAVDMNDRLVSILEKVVAKE